MTLEERVTNELLESLARELSLDTRRPGDVTVSELAKLTGRGIEAIRRDLNRRVKAGELCRRLIYDNGLRVMAYFKP